jgi:hypothetical protein
VEQQIQFTDVQLCNFMQEQPSVSKKRALLIEERRSMELAKQAITNLRNGIF